MKELDATVESLMIVRNKINAELGKVHVDSVNEFSDGTVNGLRLAIEMINREIQIVLDFNLLVSM